MALEDQVIRLLLQTPGTGAIDALGKSTENYRALIDAATESLARNEITVEEWTEKAGRYQAALESQQKILQGVLSASGGQQAAESARELAEAEEMAAHAIQHETMMLEAEAAELAAVEAAQDREIATLGKQVAADMALATAGQRVVTVTREEADAVIAETDAMIRKIQVDEQLAAEELRLSNATWAEENAVEVLRDRMNGATAATGAFTTSTNSATASANKLAGGTGSLQQSIVAGSYAFQDFTATSGDLGAKLNSITNNLPTLLVGLGGVGVAISIAATAGVALYRNWDSIAGFWEERNPFPKATDDIDGLKRELKLAKDALEEMDKAGEGNAVQLAKYNELRAKTAELEAKISEEQAKQQRIKKATESSSDEQEGRAKGFQEAVKGQGQEYLDRIEAAYKKRYDDEIRLEQIASNNRVAAFNQSNATDEEKRKFAYEESQRFQQVVREVRSRDPGKAAKDLFDELLRGEANAARELDRVIEGSGKTWGGLRERMDKLNPELQKKDKQLTEELNKQGEENEKEALAENKKIAKEKSDAQADATAEVVATGHAAPTNQDAAKGKTSSDLAEITRILIAEAKDRKLDARATQGYVQAGIGRALTETLKANGVAKPDAEKVDDKARQLAAKGIADAAKAEEQHKKNLAASNERTNKERVEEQDERAKQGGYLERAQDLAAQLKMQGGVVTDPRTGRRKKLGEQEQVTYVQDQVARDLHRQVGTDERGRAVRANPRMGKDETQDVAARIASQAMVGQQAQAQVQARVVTLMERMAAQNEQMAAVNQQTDRRLDRIERKLNPAGPTAQRRR